MTMTMFHFISYIPTTLNAICLSTFIGNRLSNSGKNRTLFFFHLIHFMYNRRNVMITAFSYMVAFVFVHPYYIQTSFLLHST